MDDIQKQITKQMINTSYAEPLKKVFDYYLTKELDEILESLVVDGRRVSAHSSEAEEILKVLIKTQKVKTILCKALHRINASDCCAELLHQYGLDKTDEKTYFHDVMMKLYYRIRNKLLDEIGRH